MSASGLQTAAWPAATLTDNLSFSKQNLSEQDLSNISLDKFFPENFGKQLSEQQLQNNLSTDQRQLQENKLTQNTFQQLSLEQPSFTKKTFNKELATTFAKNSLIRQPCLSDLLLCHLGFAEDSFRTAWREQPLQEAACRKQLYPDRRRSLQRTASHHRLSRSQLEPAAFQQQLGSAEWGQSSFTTRTSSQKSF